jgi:hypothetical protein
MTAGVARAVATGRWTGAHAVVLAMGLLAAVAVRAILLPAPGLAGDIDEFAGWVHAIVVNGFGNAYDRNLTFPPVMVYTWGFLGAIEPGFRTATDASDPGIRALLKLPSTLADFGLAAGIGYALRARPWLAIAGTLGIVLHPAVIDLSALFGQYESIYTLFGLLAFLLAVSGRSELAAVALAFALMTKPQALPFVVPFAAWFLARDGWRGTMRLAAIGAITIALLWLPFLAAGGPQGYLRSVQLHQDELYSILSLRAWNAWWLVQEAGAGGHLVSDQARILGPITLRHLGYLVAGALELVVFLAVLRSPTRRTLALGLVAAVLVAFTFLTTMHERYAFGALVFLAVLIPERRLLGLWLVFGLIFTFNLAAAIPPTPEIGALLPVAGLLGVLGSLAVIAITLGVLAELRRSSGHASHQLQPPSSPGP